MLRHYQDCVVLWKLFLQKTVHCKRALTIEDYVIDSSKDEKLIYAKFVYEITATIN